MRRLGIIWGLLLFHLGSLPIVQAQNEDNPKAVIVQNATTEQPPETYLNGLAFLNGDGVIQDYEKAYTQFNLASEQGYLPAIYNLAALKAEGLGASQNLPEALALYNRAAVSGYVPAQHAMGMMIENRFGSTQPRSNAAGWYEKAASAGHAESQVSLGFLYHQGDIIKQDLDKALYWYEQAAAQENIRALNNLGLLYSRGEGVEQNYEKAYLYFEKAAIGGSQQAKRNLGVMYENGFGVPQSDSYAEALYKSASSSVRENRQALSLPADAEILALVNGAEFDIKQVQALAENGDPNGQYILAIQHLKGWRVPQDYVLAHKWLNIAHNRSGQSQIAELRGDLESRMTNQQINQAQKMARSWISENDG